MDKHRGTSTTLSITYTKNPQIRALDHAIELLYHPLASEIPTKRLALEAIRDLFAYLPLSKSDPTNADVRQKLFLAAYASLFPFLYTGGVGLSHSIGHALGATYSIPHGITSCLTLAPVIKLKAKTKKEEAKMIARVLPYVGKEGTGTVQGDAELVGYELEALVDGLGHKSSLTQVCCSLGRKEVGADLRNSMACHVERKYQLHYMPWPRDENIQTFKMVCQKPSIFSF